MDALLEVHKKYNDLVQTAFRGEAGFVASLDKACREFVNRNKICKSSTSKSPEQLARYCDSLLRKSSKNPEENDLEDILNSIVSPHLCLRFVSAYSLQNVFDTRGALRSDANLQGIDLALRR